MSEKVLITGITGQDSSYLAEYLLEQGCEVHGMDRRKSVPNDRNIAHLRNDITIHAGDLNDAVSVRHLVDMKFDKIFNLAAQSFVGSSFDEPYYTFQTNAVGVLTFLEEIRQGAPDTKFYQAATSEMFGGMTPPPYNEESMFHPRSPYGVSKLASYWLVRNYREAYGLKCCSGILFNHESPRRGDVFVTQKICDHIRNNQIGILDLGNLDARRDWGHAKDFVRGMAMILDQDKIAGNEVFEDYVLATGVAYSVRDFVELAFKKGLGVDVKWVVGETPEDEVGIVGDRVVVKVNPKFYRPSEVNILIGDATKARRDLRWKPDISFEELVDDMVKGDSNDTL